jgi:predicted transcriptional regulator
MGKNRDRLSIVADILEETVGGASKTHIMFAANLSFKLLEKYLKIVIHSGLIRSESGKYTLTIQGRDFLSNYKFLHERYITAQNLLEALDNEREKLALICNDQ